MSILTNKHVVVALIVAPILAIITYFFVDHLVRPEAKAAKSGQSYPLVARSNCRYLSGACTLHNGDFEIKLLQADGRQNGYQIDIQSKFPISGLRYALVDQQGNEITAENLNGHTFALDHNEVVNATSLQIALMSSEVLYYAETTLAFLKL